MKPSIFLQEQVGGLPTKPADPNGRHVAWLWLLGEGELHYTDPQGADKVAKLDKAALEAYLRSYDALTAQGYTAPVLRQHTPNGEREGDVLSLALAYDLEPAPKRWSLVGAVALADADARKKIEDGRIKYVSPRLGSVKLTDSGRELQSILEVSLVSAPAQKFGRTHVLAQENTMDTPTPPAPAMLQESPELMAMIKKMIAEALAENGNKTPEIEVKVEEPKAEDKKPDAMMGELAQLKRELADLKRAQADAAYQSWSATHPHVAVQLGEGGARAIFEAPAKVREETLAKLKPLVAPGGIGTSLGEPAAPKPTSQDPIEAQLGEALKRHKGDSPKALADVLAEARKQVYGA